MKRIIMGSMVILLASFSYAQKKYIKKDLIQINKQVDTILKGDSLNYKNLYALKCRSERLEMHLSQTNIIGVFNKRYLDILQIHQQIQKVVLLIDQQRELDSIVINSIETDSLSDDLLRKTKVKKDSLHCKNKGDLSNSISGSRISILLDEIDFQNTILESILFKSDRKTIIDNLYEIQNKQKEVLEELQKLRSLIFNHKYFKVKKFRRKKRDKSKRKECK